ncbi:hypothetical protein ACU8KH_04464 [Lachancea thermotolerans]
MVQFLKPPATFHSLSLARKKALRRKSRIVSRVSRNTGTSSCDYFDRGLEPHGY